MGYADDVVARENEKRLKSFTGKVADWMQVARQDDALGLPVRKFPEVPRKQVVFMPEEGEPFDIDGPEFIADTPFKLVPGPNGTYIITTPLPVPAANKGLRP